MNWPRISWKGRFRNDEGAVLIVVSLVMLPLMVLGVGGIGLFTLYGAHREMQKTADQAALAGAAALPPLNPNVVFQNLPFPIPNTDPVFEITGLQYLDVPLLSKLIPDPRAVACEYGANGLAAGSAPLTSAFAVPHSSAPPTLCADSKILPTMQSSPAFACISQIAGSLTTRLRILETDLLLAPLVPNVLATVLAPVNRAVAALNQAVPAALSPRMKVDVYSGIQAPMFEMIAGEAGLDMRVSATAVRRLKNAVVVPLVPGGQVGPVVTNSVNLNAALAQSQPILLESLAEIDQQLNVLTTYLNMPECRDLLKDFRRDVGDIYNPPDGPGPSALDLIEESVTAAEATAAATGIALSSLAGEAYYAIGAGAPAGTIGSIVTGVVGPLLASTALALLGPITAAQIPTLDLAIVVFTDAGHQDYRAAIINAANARGLFRATLVE